MQTRLVAYEALTAVQRQQASAIEVHPEQLPFCGDMYCALNSLLAKPSPGVKGFALLADDIPVAFLLLKRPPCLPHWADAHSATLHAFQVDRRQRRLPGGIDRLGGGSGVLQKRDAGIDFRQDVVGGIDAHLLT